MADGSDLLRGLDGTDRAFIIAMRRRVARDDPRLRRFVFLGVVVLHAVFVVIAWRETRPSVTPTPAPPESVMVVEFIDDEVAMPSPAIAETPDVVEPPPAESTATPIATPPPTVVRETPPPASSPPAAVPETRMSVEFVPATPATAEAPTTPAQDVRVFKSDGSVLLSKEVIDAATTKEPLKQYVEKPQEDMKLVGDHEILPFERTRFDKYWVPDGETLGQEIIRKYPAIGLLIPGLAGAGDGCPPRSIDPACEGKPVPQKMESPMPQEWYEERY
jgi:hypothetical protein